MFDIIAFDADDTLWHNESLYTATQAKFAALLALYVDGADVERQLYATESRNIAYFGYGIKSFALSMIETAIALTEGRVTSADIEQIIAFAKEMIDTPTQLLDGVAEVVAQVAASHKLMLITKGDLLDQERKLERSGLSDYFDHIEIVSEKTEATYRALLKHYAIAPERFLMVGNSLKSDVLPILALGGHAVHVPYHTTWVHEQVNPTSVQQAQYVTLAHISELPGLIEQIDDTTTKNQQI